MKPFDIGLTILFSFGLGIAIGHIQEAQWAQIDINALKAQVEKLHCVGEITYPEMLEEGRK
ncbi:hypothetical protein LCGC14_0752510 [marine sediment metagenome]|uniref:Uncharacterized protein n=1 Tax=marine sediment metagenome TaxID=412755 RepID=A0A0F9SNS8_9ZZZZ|nr:hypothetical protein [Candidatus Aminicenantes bacterium]